MSRVVKAALHLHRPQYLSTPNDFYESCRGMTVLFLIPEEADVTAKLRKIIEISQRW